MKLSRKEIGERIKEEIQKQELTQAAVAKAAHIGTDTMSDMVNGSQAKLESYVAVADVLGLSLDYLTGRDKCKNHDNQSIQEFTGLSDSAISWLHNIMVKANDNNIIFAGKDEEEIDRLWKDNTPECLESVKLFNQSGHWKISFINEIIENEAFIDLMEGFFYKFELFAVMAETGATEFFKDDSISKKMYEDLMETLTNGYVIEIGKKCLDILLEIYFKDYYNEDDFGTFFDVEKLNKYLLEEFHKRQKESEE